jgi:hypothetical protein
VNEKAGAREVAIGRRDGFMGTGINYKKNKEEEGALERTHVSFISMRIRSVEKQKRKH